MQNQFISIYVHWPFCLSKCPYCDFNSHVTANIDHNLWLITYQKEIDYFREYLQNKYVKSIFFGGGTPSLMNPKVVEGIIQKIANIANVDHNTEITLEANPTSFEQKKFIQFKAAGINRVSIGVQSLIDKDLKILGRNHNAKEALNTLSAAAKIFHRISFDLIYARTNQTLKQWQKELKDAMQFANGHISLYQLTIEKGTPFYKLFHTGKLTIPGQNIAADMYEWTNHYLESLDYRRYEISNYSRANHESIHNLAYWNYDSYLGIGPGAHSRLNIDNNIKAMMMHHKPEKWLSTVNEVGQGIQQSVYLSHKELVTEILMMGLRLSSGININIILELVGKNIEQVINISVAQEFINCGLLEITPQIIRLTDKGLILHNYIVLKLLN